MPGQGSAAVLTVFLRARRGSGFGPACSLTTVSIGLSGRAVRGDRALAPSQAHRPMWLRRLIGLPGGCEPPTPGPGKKIHGSAP
jgi:hypothetical protein